LVGDGDGELVWVGVVEGEGDGEDDRDGAGDDEEAGRVARPTGYSQVEGPSGVDALPGTCPGSVTPGA
jgi:hypothetical protein